MVVAASASSAMLPIVGVVRVGSSLTPVTVIVRLAPSLTPRSSVTVKSTTTSSVAASASDWYASTVGSNVHAPSVPDVYPAGAASSNAKLAVDPASTSLDAKSPATIDPSSVAAALVSLATGASLLPVMVIVTVPSVPSVVTIGKVSVRSVPDARASTVSFASSSS